MVVLATYKFEQYFVHSSFLFVINLRMKYIVGNNAYTPHTFGFDPWRG